MNPTQNRLQAPMLGVENYLKIFDINKEEPSASLYKCAVTHGITAIVWDELHDAAAAGEEADVLPKTLKLQWALNVKQVEGKYAQQRAVIAKLAKFFAEHGIKMMVLKGYGLSLNYPVPNHRPCGDVDIWLFEEGVAADGAMQRVVAQQRADELLRKEYGINIDESKHHHTVFYVDGVMIENHYDFLNIHAHRSSRRIEQVLIQLAQQKLEPVEVDGATVYLPSADFHALFLLRHSASHFAATDIRLRHLLDWHYFVLKYGSIIDWAFLDKFAHEVNMHRFLHCLNAICIDRFSLPSVIVPEFERDAKLEERVWREILQPEFAIASPKNAGYLRSWVFMFRRWWTNRWKHRITYPEGLDETFFVQLWSHLLKPKSLKL